VGVDCRDQHPARAATNPQYPGQVDVGNHPELSQGD